MAHRINISQFTILHTIGTGAYAKVKLARHKFTSNLIALKILKKAQILRLKQVDHVMSEFSILRTIQHPFLVSLEGFSQDERCLYFALEYIKGGQLFKYLRSVTRIQIQVAKIYTAEIVLMFQYLHNLNIIYRDLKPENLLICQDGYLKLIDFGFAKFVQGRTYTLCGTPEYLAPQILLNKGHGKGVDWWTLGIFLYEILSGINPFSDQDPMLIYQKILRGQVRFPKNFNRGAKSLVKHFLVADVGKRFGIGGNGVADVKSHRMFAGLDWNRLLQRAIQVPSKPDFKDLDESSIVVDSPESENHYVSVRPNEDPFIDW